MTLDQAIAPVAAIVVRPVPDGAMLVDLGRGHCWQVNRLGAEIWFLLDGRRTLREVCEVLRPSYDVAADVIERDVVTMVEDLLTQGMVAVTKP